MTARRTLAGAGGAKVQSTIFDRYKHYRKAHSKGELMPSFGKLIEYVLPAGPRVRVDSGYVRGGEVSQHYDSLLAKVICWGETRDEAIRRMSEALSEFHVIGVDTCIPFHNRMLDDADFKAGNYNIRTAEQKLKQGFMDKPDPKFAAVLAFALEHSGAKPPTGNGSNSLVYLV